MHSRVSSNKDLMQVTIETINCSKSTLPALTFPEHITSTIPLGTCKKAMLVTGKLVGIGITEGIDI